VRRNRAICLAAGGGSARISRYHLSAACTLRTLADMLPSQSAERFKTPWSYADSARIDPKCLTLKRIIKRLHSPTDNLTTRWEVCHGCI
jgi:hypothetical protein